MKIGLDFHGVLDKHSKTFALLSSIFVENGCEVHIITGAMITPDFKNYLKELGIRYTHLFSITDYHENIGTEVHYDKKGPWLKEDIWNKTKAQYCEKEGIDLHIDDSNEYGKHFKNTVYLQLLNNR